MSYFTRDTLDFLTELEANNDKAWFDAQRGRYQQQLREPFVRFIRDVTPHLQAVSRHYRGDDRLNGGSLFRIHRDTRFSNNKLPYKTWGGARFWHDEGGRGGSPVYYLHVQPDNSFMGAGVWHPDADTLRRIRHFLHHNPNTWLDLVSDPAFCKRFELGGDSLKRMPRGFEPDDPVAEHLKRKDFVISTRLSDADVLRDDLPAFYGQLAREAGPFMDYLCAALDLDF